MLALVSSHMFPVNKSLTEASLGVLKLSGGDTCGSSDKAKVPYGQKCTRVLTLVLKLPSFQVFRIDVLMNGRQHTVEKRYSEFHTLHKMVRTSQRWNGQVVWWGFRNNRFCWLTNLLANGPERAAASGTYIFDLFVILQLKKSIKPPEIPSKHVRNWVPKVLEQRRHGLELYLQVFGRTFAHMLCMETALNVLQVKNIHKL